jgi:predicted transcriptional regulator
MRCTNLSQHEFEELVSPLVSTNILKQMRDSETTGSQYQLTSQGEQFIDFLILGLNYVELGDNTEKPKVKHG